ncbi:hypothetical protein [Roseateles sp.]|uniref:hypothetical protein n=1 Tax=Roseateles sp. TaxID=1971397 RepID=UPI003BAD2CDB
MNTSTHDFVTVDMRGLKAALVAHAKAKRCSVSVVVRDAVARELASDATEGAAQLGSPEAHDEATGWVKLSIRVRRTEADRLAAGARAAQLSRGAYLVGLSDGVPVLRTGGRAEHISSLVASCAELSTLSRNTHQLTALLREGNVRQAIAYRDMLDSMTAELREHLRLAAQVLSALQNPRASSHGAPNRRQQKRSDPWHKV